VRKDKKKPKATQAKGKRQILKITSLCPKDNKTYTFIGA
jgi:hypothetical protein